MKKEKNNRNTIFSNIACIFVLLHLVIVLSVFQITASDYPFGIFKLFFGENSQ